MQPKCNMPKKCLAQEYLYATTLLRRPTAKSQNLQVAEISIFLFLPSHCLNSHREKILFDSPYTFNDFPHLPQNRASCIAAAPQCAQNRVFSDDTSLVVGVVGVVADIGAAIALKAAVSAAPFASLCALPNIWLMAPTCCARAKSRLEVGATTIERVSPNAFKAAAN